MGGNDGVHAVEETCFRHGNLAAGIPHVAFLCGGTENVNRSGGQDAGQSNTGRRSRYAWLEWEGSQMAGKFLSKPDRADIPENIREQLIVELYSK